MHLMRNKRTVIGHLRTRNILCAANICSTYYVENVQFWQNDLMRNLFSSLNAHFSCTIEQRRLSPLDYGMAK